MYQAPPRRWESNGKRWGLPFLIMKRIVTEKTTRKILKLSQPNLFTTDWRSIESIGKAPTHVSGKQHLSGRIHITKGYELLIKKYKGIIEKSVSATIIIIEMAHVGLLVRNHNLPSTYFRKHFISQKGKIQIKNLLRIT